MLIPFPSPGSRVPPAASPGRKIAFRPRHQLEISARRGSKIFISRLSLPQLCLTPANESPAQTSSRDLAFTLSHVHVISPSSSLAVRAASCSSSTRCSGGHARQPISAKKRQKVHTRAYSLALANRGPAVSSTSCRKCLEQRLRERMSRGQRP
jgi:hypothetical protein